MQTAGHTLEVNGQVFKGNKTQLMSAFARVMRVNTPSPVQTTFQTHTLPQYVKQWFGGEITMTWNPHRKHYVFESEKHRVTINKKHASSARTAINKYVKLRMLEEGIKDGRWGNNAKPS
jgi:hypothetical protein